MEPTLRAEQYVFTASIEGNKQYITLSLRIAYETNTLSIYNETSALSIYNNDSKLPIMSEPSLLDPELVKLAIAYDELKIEALKYGQRKLQESNDVMKA